MDTELARENMIEQQIRTWEVLDQNVLDLINEVHREDFIPQEFKALAFADTRIPIGHEQVTMTPKVEARLLQSVDIKPTDRVLEIGTGCAYLTALLAKSAEKVISIDIYADFISSAQKKLDQHSISNVELITGDVFAGWKTTGVFDVIVVTGSVPVLDDVLLSNLNTGGRMFVIVGESPAMEALLLKRVDDEQCATESLFETDLPVLIGAASENQFEF